MPFRSARRPGSIWLEKRQEDSSSLDTAHLIPRIVRDGCDYDKDLELFLRLMPTLGVRSPHSMRAYANDIVVWLRFLDANSKGVWQATRHDVDYFHAARRGVDSVFGVTARSWNRSVAAIDKLYTYAVDRGLIAQSPLPTKSGWVRLGADGPLIPTQRKIAYEGAARSNSVKSIGIAEYQTFRNVGLLGQLQDGRDRPGARDRNSCRNAAFSDLMITTGLRLEECSALLASEIIALDNSAGLRQIPFRLPKNLTKGNVGREVRISRRIISALMDYINLERSNAVEKFKSRERWKEFARPIWVSAITPRAASIKNSRGEWSWISLDKLTPDVRLRMVMCEEEGRPASPAALWLSEVGMPLQPNSWEVIFKRAAVRCRSESQAIDVTPHVLRHTFAIYMLALLVREAARAAHASELTGGDEAYRRLTLDPLRELQKLLGHRSIETTYIYLEHLRSIGDNFGKEFDHLFDLITYGEVADAS